MGRTDFLRGLATWSCRGLVRLCLLLAVLAATQAAHAAPGGDVAIERWRAEAARVRLLAENDVPLVYQQARQLQSTLPPTATPADRVRALNVLARAELYLAQTEAAGIRAEHAFTLAQQHGDKVGQAEANLTIAMNAVNQGRIDRLIGATTLSIKILDGLERPVLMAEAMLRTAMRYLRSRQMALLETGISRLAQS